MAQPASRNARGVTLLELLVSLGVMIVLVSIAVPSLQGARRSAQRAACLVNLRSIGQALAMFRAENNDHLPYAINQIDVRLGYLDPLPALARHLEAPAPRLDERANVITSAPYLCPSDTVEGPADGASYYYTPIDLMTFYPREFAPRAVTAWLGRDPTVVVFMDDRKHHEPRNSNRPMLGTNVLRLDGGAEAATEQHDVNPRH